MRTRCATTCEPAGGLCSAATSSRLQTGPLSAEQQAWYAVLDGGRHCVITGLSALHRYGLSGFPVDRVQTVVPATGTAASTDSFMRRRSRRPMPQAVHPVRRPPMTTVPVAVVHALESMATPARGCALLAAVVQQRLMRASDLRPLVNAQRTLRHRATYLAVSGDIDGGSHSLTEIDVVRLARAAGVGCPRRQVVRVDGSGRRRYLDADFGGFVAEVDGAVHLRPLAWWEDMSRQNEIVLADRPMLRFASVAIYLRQPEVVDQLRRAAQRWGTG